nr:unnamed protein product [Callosobruchus chinensis]
MNDAVAGPSREFNVNKVNSGNRGSNQGTRCGKFGHTSNSKDCPAKYAKCHKCSYQGHFAFMCKTAVRVQRIP